MKCVLYCRFVLRLKDSQMIILKTNYGDIEIELDQKNTPKTAANFIEYVKEGFYDSTLFHRVIDGFMIQGGGFSVGMQQKKTKAPIMNEAKHSKPNIRGSVAMARTSDPHSATAQFFINVADNKFLNFTNESPQGFGYCVFGTVVNGMDVIDRIKAVNTTHKSGHADVPVNDIVIESVRLIDSMSTENES